MRQLLGLGEVGRHRALALDRFRVEDLPQPALYQRVTQEGVEGIPRDRGMAQNEVQVRAARGAFLPDGDHPELAEPARSATQEPVAGVLRSAPCAPRVAAGRREAQDDVPEGADPAGHGFLDAAEVDRQAPTATPGTAPAPAPVDGVTGGAESGGFREWW